MKRTALILSALMCMASRHPDRMIRSDLHLNMSFNRGDISDRSMYSQTTALAGSAVVTAGNRYLSITSGTTDQVTVSDADTLSFTDGAGTDRPFSISCWVYLNALPTAGNRAGLAKKGTQGGTATWEYDVWAQILDTTTGPAFTIRSSTSSALLQRTAPALSATTWYFLTFTYDGSETIGGLKIYRDSVRVDNASVTSGTYTGMSNTATPLNVGSQSFGGTNPAMNGRIDDFRVYNRELSAADVQSIFSAGRDP